MGGESIYGSPFADEDLSHELDSQGYVIQAYSHPSLYGRDPRAAANIPGHLQLLPTIRPTL